MLRTLWQKVFGNRRFDLQSKVRPVWSHVPHIVANNTCKQKVSVTIESEAGLVTCSHIVANNTGNRRFELQSKVRPVWSHVPHIVAKNICE